MVYVALRPIHTSGGMHEHNEGVERTCAAKSPEHVFRQVVEWTVRLYAQRTLTFFHIAATVVTAPTAIMRRVTYRLCYKEGVQI
jgi:hypothetical protein